MNTNGSVGWLMAAFQSVDEMCWLSNFHWQNCEAMRSVFSTQFSSPASGPLSRYHSGTSHGARWEMQNSSRDKKEKQLGLGVGSVRDWGSIAFGTS